MDYQPGQKWIMIYSNPVGLRYQTYILSFLHVCLESEVQDHTANLEMLFPYSCHRMLCKFAARQRRVFTGIKDTKQRDKPKELSWWRTFLTSATLLGTPSPSTSRAKTGCGMNPLTPEQRLNASLKRCISSSVTETSSKQTKRKSAEINNETSLDLADRPVDQLKTYLSSSLPRTQGSKVLTP